MKKNLAGILILMYLGTAVLLFALPQEQDTEAAFLVPEATPSVGLTDAADLDDALQRGLKHDGPSLIEVITDAQLV